MKFKPLTFELALEELLLIEGGASGDAGGTDLGVTQPIYDEWRHKHDLSTQKVSLITRDEARDIYFNYFWRPLKIEKMRPDFGLTLFIQAVNLPWGEAVRILQGVMARHGAYRGMIDGAVGPATIEATNAMAEGTVVGALDGYAADYAIDEGKDRHGLIQGRLQKIAEAVGRLPIEGE